MSYGLTVDGFVIKSLSQIVTELQDSYKLAFGAGIPLDGKSVFGELIGIHSEREAAIWTLAQAIYLSQDPDSATGVSLERVMAYTGKFKLQPTGSVVTVTVTGTPATVIPAGSQVGLTGTVYLFETDSEVVIPGGGSTTVSCTCTVTGPVAAGAGTVTTIATPVVGWTAVTNAAAATPGRDLETDPAARARRVTDLAFARASQVDAIRQAVAAVQDVTFVSVVENRLDVDDTAGRPPHSIAVTVTGGTSADVAAAIWATKGGGPATYGTTAYIITDSAGNAQVINFTRSTPVPVYVTVTLVRNPMYPTSGDTAVAAAIAAYGALLTTGLSVVDFQLQLSLAAIAGIDRATFAFGRTASPTSNADLVMASDELATIDLGHVVVL